MATILLPKLFHDLAWNDAFGCYNRNGFEKLVWPEIAVDAKWIIYFDVDGMHELNESHKSYDPVDAMIKEALAVLRNTDYVAGQWKSGDEFLICLTKKDLGSGQRERLDPQRMMERLIEALKKHKMSATFAIVPVISLNLAANVKPAVDQVYAAKKLRGDQR